MKAALYLLVALAAFVLQTTAFQFVPWLTVYPDIILALAIHGGLRWGRMAGIQFGGALGFAQDLLLVGTLGMNLLSKSLIGFVVGALREKYISDSMAAWAILVIAATAFDLFVYDSLTSALFGFDLSFRATGTLAAQCVANLVFTLVALPVLSALDDWAGKARKRISEDVR